MRLRQLGWGIALAGLPWSFFLVRLVSPFKSLDIWHANTWWMHGWLLVLAGVHAQTRQDLGRLPAAVWWVMIWVTISTLWIFTSQLKPGHQYPAAILLGMLHLWMAVLGMLLLTSQDPDFFVGLSQAIFWSGVVLVSYGYLQAWNLDQFFHFVDNSRQTDSVVGMIGNPTHFACQLAIWLPFALIQPFPNKLWSIPGAGLIVLSSSSTALVVASLLGVAYVWRHSRALAAGLGCALGGLGAYVVFTHPGWLNPFGRFEVWHKWWPAIEQHAITGWGVGFIRQVTGVMPPTNPLSQWKHLHNEYLQFWVEAGVIGLLLLGWVGVSLVWRKSTIPQDSLAWASGWSVVACALISLLSFPLHLWQLGGWVMFAVSCYLVRTQERPRWLSLP